MSKKVFVYKAIGPFLVLLLASLIAFWLVFTKPPVEKKTGEEIVRKVEAIAVKKQKALFPIDSQGVVLPITHIRYLSQVSGQILSVAPNWQDGGFFHKGDIMLSVEDPAYKSQLAKAEAQLAQAQMTLTQEIALADVAEKTWEAGKRTDDNPAARSLALREPQIEAAKAQLAAAKADVELARIMLEKTRIRAPFDGIINNKQVDIGQVLSSGQHLADFYGISKAEIQVPLTQAQQAYLDLPPLAKATSTPVEVIYKAADKTHRLAARLVRTSGVLDEKTRVLHGIIEVDDPYNLKQNTKKVVLPMGAFVEVEIASQEQADIIQLPKRLLRPGNRIWVADKNDRLQLRAVILLPSQSDTIYIQHGLEPDDRVITSSIVDAYPGNPVSVSLMDSLEN